MQRKYLLSLAGFAVFLTTSWLLGSGAGAIPGETSSAGTMPNNLNTGYPGCGATGCHSAFPNFNVKVDLQMTTSITKGVTVPMSAAVSGAVSTSTRGGFSLEADRGTLVAGTTTRVGATPSLRSAITHKDSLARNWSFQFTPPSTTGLVRFYATGNCVNGDGQPTGDGWGWHGLDSAVPGAPFRAFVNDDQVFAFGTSCKGSKGFEPVLGIAKNVAVAGIFDTEVYNVPPQTAAISVLGISNTFYGALPLPFDLAPLGAPGCVLRVSMDVMQPAITTGAGDGNGVARVTWAIPNAPSLRGLNLYFQALTIDAPANKLGLTLSMGLRAVIQ
jgi:hypothetical protein